ncbi:hypothetical protein SH528x_005860 [Novipirellula sp. SH528]|uniref:hypothetical protein n=1 Tax=Novipirellula sp. SH528 TaxID=3454466 RepID=UPI003FA049B2
MITPPIHHLPLSILAQPSDSDCGPTCLHAVYNYWKDEIPLEQVIREIGQFRRGGTLAVQLACHALARGYEATIVTYNLQFFDPTWFPPGRVDLAEKLKAQCAAKKGKDERFEVATESYLQFLDMGGQVQMEPLEENLIVRTLIAGVPLLSGLSATFLYQEARERYQVRDESGRTCITDDVAGDPVGHFVVLYGYDGQTGQVMLADPLQNNPIAATHLYTAPLSQVAAAILLGIATYDANLLMIRPRNHRPTGKASVNV